MNDTELDELLDAWKCPSPRAGLRERLQGEIGITPSRPPRRLFTRRRLAAAAAILVFAFLFVSTDASSANPPTYTVESEIKHYDGALRWTQWPKRILMTSYSDAGNEVILSWSYPDNPLDTAYIKMLILTEEGSKTLKRRFNRIVRSYYTWKYDLKEPASSSPEAFAYLTDPDEPFYLERQASLLSSGCHDVRSGRAKVVGQDVALNYATTVVQLHQNEDRPQWHTRITIWMAPELSCAVLRATVETHQAGGWRVVTERKALRVSVNRSN